MANWFKKAQNWFNKQRQSSRYSFSIEGDIFIEEQEDKEQEKMVAQELLTQAASSVDVHGIRINSQNVAPYQRVI
ncbi:MAG: hypothetical protein ACTSSP_10670 [Candidatus Asgardarchaeia archaeon]